MEETTLTDLICIFIRKNNLEAVEEIIAQGVDLNIISSCENKLRGELPLGVAAFENRPNIVQLLLENGANVNGKDRHNNSALHKAAESNNGEIATILLSKGAEVNLTNGVTKETPLFKAATMGHKEVAQILIAGGASIEEKSLDVISYFVLLGFPSKTGPIYEVSNELGHTPIFTAVRHGRIEIVRLLEKCGADINEKCSYDRTEKETPLDAALGIRELEIAKFLISKNAKLAIELTNEGGVSAVYSSLKFFESAGLNLDFIQNPESQSIECSKFFQEIKTAEKLLLEKKEAGFQHECETSALHFAICNYGSNLATFLLANGAKVDSVNSHGKTPLHCAAENDEETLTDLLLRNGANANALDKEGNSPLDLASKQTHQNPEIIKVISEAGGLCNNMTKRT